MIVKTSVQQQWNIIFPNSGPGYTILGQPVDVDNEKWYTIHVEDTIASWIRTQVQDQWYEHLKEITRYNFHEPHQPKFDVHYELLTILKLTWG